MMHGQKNIRLRWSQAGCLIVLN